MGQGQTENATSVSYPCLAAFFLVQYFLGCYESLTLFQSSERTVSESFDVSVEGHLEPFC